MTTFRKFDNIYLIRIKFDPAAYKFVYVSYLVP